MAADKFTRSRCGKAGAGHGALVALEILLRISTIWVLRSSLSATEFGVKRDQ